MSDVSTAQQSNAPAEPTPEGVAAPAPPADERLVEAELLVEDVSIDGMCGVY
jgi:mycofactocin precursor